MSNDVAPGRLLLVGGEQVEQQRAQPGLVRARSATYRLRGLCRLLPLPCANTTTPGRPPARSAGRPARDDAGPGPHFPLQSGPAGRRGAPRHARSGWCRGRRHDALNNLNILTIYELALTNATHFLAFEYVEGKTLREKLQGEQLSCRTRPSPLLSK